ncbi:60S ribosomal protein L9B, partial [Coemansia sp. RSA 638]
ILTMKHICKDDVVNIPEGVTVEVKARQVRVTGPRGTLSRDLRHIQMDIQRPSKSQLRVIVWKGGRKHIACIRTVCSHIDNLIKG